VGVDPHSRSSILDLVRELRDEGKAVIFSTHYIEEAERVADRVAIIDRGSVIAAGTVDELVRLHAGPPIATIESESGVRRLRLTDPAAELPDLLREPGVRGLRVDRPSLEAVFMTLTGRSLRD
jgi:ABC-2 type transport system ATP-binding protein